MVSSASTWVKFFVAAGVPSVTAAKYAHVFYENRIQMDMLVDLNKEYLREMGINPMGDIIAILRHAKSVFEQNAREKILLQETDQIPIATVSASPVVANAPNRVVRSEISSVAPLANSVVASSTTMAKPARRVLPEHEGRYKITLPSGTTQRSKEILAKKAMLYSDKDDKKGIFDRLQLPKNDDCVIVQEQLIKVTGLDKPTSSVFARLGGKEELEDKVIDQSRMGILKKPIPPKMIIRNTGSSIKRPMGIVKKAALKPQKVILVKKQPAKAATMVADEYEQDRMETGEKSVSFSSEDEVLVIAPRKTQQSPRAPTHKITNFNANVKDRLGFHTKSADTRLHAVKKTISLKSSDISKRKPQLSTSGASMGITKMKSDAMQQRRVSVQSRLTLNNKSNGKSLSSPVRQLSKLSLKTAAVQARKREPASSVFERLGFSA